MTLKLNSMKIEVLTAHNNSEIIVQRRTCDYDTHISVSLYYSSIDREEDLYVCLEDKKAMSKLERIIRYLEKNSEIRDKRSDFVRSLYSVSIRTHDMMLAEKVYSVSTLQDNLEYVHYALECSASLCATEQDKTMYRKVKNIERFLVSYANEVLDVLSL